MNWIDFKLFYASHIDLFTKTSQLYFSNHILLSGMEMCANYLMYDVFRNVNERVILHVNKNLESCRTIDISAPEFDIGKINELS